MNLFPLHVTLKKAAAILTSATPMNLYELNEEQMRWLVHAARDYVEEALADLDAEMGHSPEENRPCR